MAEIQVKGRHITQRPGPLECQTGQAKFYGEVGVGERFVTVRVDDELHPDFWIEVLIPNEQLERLASRLLRDHRPSRVSRPRAEIVRQAQALLSGDK